MRSQEDETLEPAAATWRWLFGWLYHIAIVVARPLWRLLERSIQKAEQFEHDHPEYERPLPAGESASKLRPDGPT